MTKRTRKVAVVYQDLPKISSLEDYMESVKECERFSAYRDLLRRLGLYQNSGLKIGHYSLQRFLEADHDALDLIALDSYTGRTSQLERELIPSLLNRTLEKVVNLSGEPFIQEEMKHCRLEEIDFSKYAPLAPKIFAGNKALTYFLLGNHPSLIRAHAFGFGSQEHSNCQFPSRTLIAKPAQGSEGVGIRKVDGSSFPFLSLEDCVLGCELVQDYIRQETVEDYNRASDLRIIVTRDGGEYRYHGMLRVGEEGATCSNLSSGGFGIGIVPGRRIRGEPQRQIARIYGINPDNPQIPQQILQYSQELADKFNYPILGLDFVAQKNSEGSTRFRLLEANSNPGERIFYYLGLTSSRPLTDFVQRQGLENHIKKSDCDKTPASELAKARIVKMVHVMRANNIDTSAVERALGLDSNVLSGFRYESYSKITPVEKKEKRGYAKPRTAPQPYSLINDFFEDSFLQQYFIRNGFTRGLRDRSVREAALDRLINRNQLHSSSLGINKSLEQGIIDSYNALRSEYNSLLCLPEEYHLLEDCTNGKAKDHLYRLSELLLRQALTAQKQLAVSLKLYHQAKGTPTLDAKIHNYRQALQVDSHFLKAKSNLGLVYAQKGEMDLARQTLQEVLAEDPYRERTLEIYQEIFGGEK